MNDKSADLALMLSLKRKAISNLDFKALIDIAPYVEATGMSFEELVAMYREISVMSPAEKVAMAEEEIAWLDTVIEQQQEGTD